VDQVRAICSTKRVKLLGLAVAANHVHLRARLRPRHAPAQVMQWIKSTTSLVAFDTFPALGERFGGIRKLWSAGYHVETLGEKNPFVILAYLIRILLFPCAPSCALAMPRS